MRKLSAPPPRLLAAASSRHPGTRANCRTSPERKMIGECQKKEYLDMANVASCVATWSQMTDYTIKVKRNCLHSKLSQKPPHQEKRI